MYITDSWSPSFPWGQKLPDKMTTQYAPDSWSPSVLEARNCLTTKPDNTYPAASFSVDLDLTKECDRDISEHLDDFRQKVDGCMEQPLSSARMRDGPLLAQAQQGRLRNQPLPACSTGSLYAPLPERYAHCSFNAQAAWGSKVKQSLKKEGFVVLREFVPPCYILPLLELTYEHAKTVLAAFSPPYKRIVEGLDFSCLVPGQCDASLPGKVWTKHSGREPSCFNPFAERHKWGFSRTMGYQADLGGGQMFCGDLDFMRSPWLCAAQEFLRPYVAFLEGVPPSHMVREPEGVTLKGQGAPPLKLHLDNKDVDRFQVVIMLSDSAFTVVPLSSSALSSGEWRRPDLSKQSFHFPAHVMTALEPCQVTFAACGGDVLIFQGGVVPHGSPGVPKNAAPRVATYCKVWAPRSAKGRDHLRQCVHRPPDAVQSRCKLCLAGTERKQKGARKTMTRPGLRSRGLACSHSPPRVGNSSLP